MTREPIGYDWLETFRDRFADEFPEPSKTSSITTQDGTVIVTDTAGISVSGRNLEEAQANYERAQA